MTYIPGTGTVNPPPIETKNEPTKPEPPSFFTVVNVTEMKKTKEEKMLEHEIGFNQLKYWLIFGAIGSMIFITLAIYDLRFLFLIPLGPYASYLAWNLRRWFKVHMKHTDALFS